MVKSHGQETLTFDVPVSALEDGTLTLDFLSLIHISICPLFYAVFLVKSSRILPL